ncbi:MAG: hypothetical protein LBK71_05510 [Verrucomicrobiales bacterium]|jgi:hypothetical protein|nr:hypothetical protein [Verrucomicrobiales bacterium]
MFARFLNLPLLLLAALTCAAATAADTDKAKSRPTPPDPLYRGQLGGDFTFVAEYQYKEPPAGAKDQQPSQAARDFFNSRPKTIKLEAVQTGTIRRDIRYFNTDTFTETWRYGGMRFVRRSYNPTTYDIGDSGSVPDQQDLGELNWVTAATYQGEQTRKGRKYHVYQLGDRTAYVTADTLQPAWVESDTLLITYTFGPPPDQPLKIDEKLLKGLQKVRRSWAGVED